MSTSQSQDDPRLTERICLVRFAYHLWRVDTAARAFAGLDKKQVDSMETMKKRWEIGLVLEIEDFRRYIADACMLGFMTTTLSQCIARVLDWVRLDKYPVEIVWDKLPDENHARAPMLPWMFGYSPNYLKAQLHWWDNPETPSDKPSWWHNPNKLVWLNEIRVPRSLLGDYLSVLRDSAGIMDKAGKLLTHYANLDNSASE